MDSPHFTLLCFLLLTIAAPCPNIAMPSNNPVEGAQVSSFGKTYVTVYHCEDCESHICKSSNYEDFVKIGETQSETFSNEIIQLVTTETQILMCFKQENTSPGGIYAIVWEKAIGMGDSCGMLDSGVSSENTRDNTIKTCCVAETNVSVPSPSLKCYTEMSDKRARKSTADIPDEDTPRFSINVGIITTVIIVGVCAAALAACRVWNRNRQVLHKTLNDV
ncbi:uncharacterized protein LOC135996192 isoform X2 [Caloenas nicobarica]|uniref:uncharacterized protein LOC135996192 isoform X2 n=1 Tax=Caloenas nicobarica TaxID=187106 RepID=UPI0032B791C0